MPQDERRGAPASRNTGGENVDTKTYASDVPDDTLAASLAGDSDSELTDALKAAKPEPKGDYLPPPAPCDNGSKSTK
jgi:hypothetical protein